MQLAAPVPGRLGRGSWRGRRRIGPEVLEEKAPANRTESQRESEPTSDDEVDHERPTGLPEPRYPQFRRHPTQWSGAAAGRIRPRARSLTPQRKTLGELPAHGEAGPGWPLDRPTRPDRANQRPDEGPARLRMKEKGRARAMPPTPAAGEGGDRGKPLGQEGGPEKAGSAKVARTADPTKDRAIREAERRA